MKTKKVFRNVSAIILAGFGLLTLFLSFSVIFDFFGIREKEGNYVLLVVWANFIASLLYLFAAFGFVKLKRWTTLLLGLASIILITAFILLRIHIHNGGIYELKTVNAMIFRIGLTVLFMIIAYLTITKGSRRN
ncbi:hypothetical protein ERX46_09600 [Brumimicrobium glaciale]|uniref:DUF4293 family protein n=1 Tax=Brumimicrobium glaciale TaxID=200475 RepID=A0A4Q4KLM9_9FLAO|nr:hypothetical protein [Brumimicrobium glaciale]RYM34202.1 hypothetical protein ERX46_09600 [Brumimicrobium glaciale]